MSEGAVERNRALLLPLPLPLPVLVPVLLFTLSLMKTFPLYKAEYTTPTTEQTLRRKAAADDNDNNKDKDSGDGLGVVEERGRDTGFSFWKTM